MTGDSETDVAKTVTSKGTSQELESLRLPYIDEQDLIRKRPRLFHYTSVRALGGILQDGALWATHFKHTNDAVEFYAALPHVFAGVRGASEPRLRRYFRTRPHQLKRVGIRLEEAIDRDGEQFLAAIIRTAENLSPPHIACFSAHDGEASEAGGHLTLWRGYAAAEGVCIGFDTAALVRATEQLHERCAVQFAYLLPVTYGPRDAEFRKRLADMEAMGDIYAQWLVEGLKHRALQDIPLEMFREWFKFLVASSVHKHPAFVDEREVRLVVGPMAENIDPRGRPSMPRVAGAIPRVRFGCISAIRSIMIGPSACQEAVTARVSSILAELQIRDIEVSKSDIPFRAGR